VYWGITLVLAGCYAWRYATGAQKLHIIRHRSWAIRHVAAGLSVATQRVFIGASHGWCRLNSLRCEDPIPQKGIFSDSLALGVLTCVVAGEVAIRDLRVLDTRAKVD
jgi:hypothetical protein